MNDKLMNRSIQVEFYPPESDKYDKYIHGLLPAILIHLSIGCIYSWTTMAEDISYKLMTDLSTCHWIFSISMFVVGISAAFSGRLTEKDITLSTGISSFLFILGLIISLYGLNNNSYLILLIGYGLIMSIGIGLGYIAPIKNLMLWFPNHEGMAIGVTILGFGFSSSISTYIIFRLNSLGYTIEDTISFLIFIYYILLTAGICLIKRPKNYISSTNSLTSSRINSDIRKLIFRKEFILIWFIMLICITSGLAVISNSQQMLLNYTVFDSSTIMQVLIFIGILNGISRLLSYSTDQYNNKIKIFYLIFGFPIVSYLISYFYENLSMLPIMIFSSTIAYGAGFSCLPIALKESFNIKYIGTLHGISLTAWAVAGLIGNQLGDYVLNNYSIEAFLWSMTILYVIGFVLTIILVKSVKSSRS